MYFYQSSMPTYDTVAYPLGYATKALITHTHLRKANDADDEPNNNK